MTIEEAYDLYGEPIGYTRRGPVWLVNGENLYAFELLGLEEFGCSC